MSLKDLHDIFRQHPELEQKYLNMMKMPVTGKESICLPFSFQSHRQHTCLDLSPYGNEQVCKSACTKCCDGQNGSPSASDAMVAFINQPSNIMRNRRFYYGFRKDMDLLKMSANQPQLFQIYHIVDSSIPGIMPFMFAESGIVHMHIVFENQNIHIPCECINQLLAVAKETYSLVLDITRGYIVLTARCTRSTHATVNIDVAILQRKADELEIPNDVNEQFERYKAVFEGSEKY